MCLNECHLIKLLRKIQITYRIIDS